MVEGAANRAVGYRRPPVGKRFKKGQSGNPSGRPRGPSLAKLLREALDQTVTVEIDGKRRRVSRAKAIVARLVDGAANADPRSLRLLLDLVQKLETRGLLYDDDDEPSEEEVESARKRIMDALDRLAIECGYEQPQGAAAATGEPAAAANPFGQGGQSG